MSDVLDYVRQREPKFNDVPDQELTKFIGETKPEFLKDPAFKEEFQTAIGYKDLSKDQPLAIEKPAGPVVMDQVLSDSSPVAPAREEPIDILKPVPQEPPIKQRKGFASMSELGASLTDEAKNTWEEINTPLFEILPLLTPEEQSDLGKYGTKGGKITTGFYQATAGTLNFFTSPLGIATLGIGALPKIIQRLVAGAFAVSMASHTPEIARELGTEFGKPEEERDLHKISELATSGTYNTLFTVLGGKHALTSRPPGMQLAMLLEKEVKGTDLAKGELGAVFERAANEALQQPQIMLERVAPQTAAAMTEVMGGAGKVLFPPKTPITPKAPLQNLPRSTFKPEVPGTPAEPQRNVHQIEEIRQAGAHTKEAIRKLFPQIDREMAAKLRDEAWPEEAAEREIESTEQIRLRNASKKEDVPHGVPATPSEPAKSEITPGKPTPGPVTPQKPAAAQVAEEIGWTWNPEVQSGGVKLEGLPPELAAQMPRQWEFTDRRPDSPTKGYTFYVPEGASPEIIRAAAKSKAAEVTPAVPPSVAPPVAPAATPKPKWQDISLTREEVLPTGKEAVEALMSKHGLERLDALNLLHREREKHGVSTDDLISPTAPPAAEPGKTTSQAPVEWMGMPLEYWKKLSTPEGVKKLAPTMRQRLSKSLGVADSPTAISTKIKERVAEIEAPKQETTTIVDPAQVPVQEVPIYQIKLSKDVPNFKAEADEATGVVRGQQLEGKFERLGATPIVVWKRLNGDLEVITGRHRLDLARRSGEKTIPAQVVEEAQGFTREMALTFDAEANIRDGQGTVADYATYFENSPQLDEATARSSGLLSRAKGKAGFDLARHASNDLRALWRDGKISEAQALAITRAAPDNPQAQQIGSTYALQGKPADFLTNVVKAFLSESGKRGQQPDLTGFDDTAIKTMEEWASRASRFQRELSEQIRAVQGAVKRPEIARAMGVDVKDPEAIAQKIGELRAELDRWENWPLHPDLVAKVKGEAAPTPAPTPTLRPGETIGDLFQGKDQPFNLAGETGSDQSRIAKEKADAEGLAREAEELARKQQQELPTTKPKRPMTAEEIEAGNKQLMSAGMKAVPDVEKEFDTTYSPRMARKYLPEAIEDALTSNPELERQARVVFPNETEIDAIAQRTFDELSRKVPYDKYKDFLTALREADEDVRSLASIAWRTKREFRATEFAVAKLRRQGYNETDARAMLQHDNWTDARQEVWEKDPGLGLWIERNVLGRRNYNLEPIYTDATEIVGAGGGTISTPGPGLGPSTGQAAQLPLKGQREIITDLAKGLGIPIRFRRLRTTRFAGYFMPRANLIGVAKAIDMPVSTHEVGHKIDQMFNLRSDPAIRAELDVLGNPATPGSRSSWTPSKSRTYKMGEGVAEFLRYWFTDPAHAQNVAPNTLTKFEAILNANKDFADVARQAQHDIQAWRNAPAQMRLMSHVSVGNNPNKTRYTLSQLTRDLVDNLHFLRLSVMESNQLAKRELRPSDDPYVLARNLRGSYGMADTFISKGVTDFKTKAVKLGTSFEDALKPVAGRLEDFRAFIIAKQARELHSQGKETGLLDSDINTVISQFDSDPAFGQAFNDLKAWQDAVLQYAVDAEFVSPSSAAHMRKMNRDYVPFHRVFEVGAGEAPAVDGGGTGRGLNVGKPGSLRTRRGSTAEIIDPLETSVKNAYSLITASEKAAINNAVAALAERPGMGKWVEQIRHPMEKTTLGIEKIREQLEAAGADLTNVPDDLLLSFWRNSSRVPFGENVIRVAGPDGTAKYYRLNRDLFETFHALDLEDSGKIIQYISAPTQVLRAGVVMEPAFALANAFRDAFNSAVIGKRGSFPFEALTRGLGALINDPKLVAEFAASGGKSAVEASYFDRGKMQRFLRERITKDLSFAEQALVIAKSPLTALRWFSGMFEEATRIGEYKIAFDQLRKGGMPEGDARRLAAFEARDRQDFAKGGAKTKAVRRMAAFWNAALQANVKLAQAFKERPLRTTLQGIAFITLPKLLEQAVNWDDEDYWDRPQWERDLFFLFPIGKDNNGHTKFLRLPTPFEVGIIFGTLPGRVLQWWKENNPEAAASFPAMMLRQSVPNPLPQSVQVLHSAARSGPQGWDPYRGRPIIPDSLSEMPPEMQWTEQTSLTARNVGKALGVPPMKVDHVIAGTTGNLGRQVTHQIIDRAIEAVSDQERTAKGTAPGGRFITTPANVASQSIEEFYSTLKELRTELARQNAGQPPRMEVAWVNVFDDVSKDMAQWRKASRNPQSTEQEKERAREMILQLARLTMKQYREAQKKKG